MRVRLALLAVAAAAIVPLSGSASATYCNPQLGVVCDVFYKVCNAAGPCPVE